MVTESGVAKLTDFGIAKMTEETVTLTDSGAILGTVSYASPEQLSGHPLGPPSDLYSMGCVLYECLAGHPPFTADNIAALVAQQQFELPQPLDEVLPDIPEAFAETVMRALAKDPVERFPSASDMVQAFGSFAIEGPESGIGRVRPQRAGSSTKLAARPPYPGLAAMDVEDADVFFGRDSDVSRLVQRVEGQSAQPDGDFVVVVGPSGAGKSSLVRAGLCARLSIPGSPWVVAAPFEPGPRPLDRLANRLVDLAPGQISEDECRRRLLTTGVGALAEWLVEHQRPRAKRLLIILDQAEQLATVTQSGERDEFLAALAEGLALGSPLTLVMTVRSDRLDEAQRLPAIGAAIDRPLVISAMDRSQLAAAIEGPARHSGLVFDARLVNLLIDDAMRGSVTETVDALPLLAFTLREMYDRVVTDGRRTITIEDYEQVGRIGGAIARRAQVAESSLPPDSELVLEQLLPRFVTLSNERSPIGRSVHRHEFTPTEQAIVRKLEDQRLLTGTEDTIHLVHEQLITSWPTLSRAVADRRDELLLQARLERQANDWMQGTGELLGRDAAHVATNWLSKAGAVSGGGVVGEYIRSSQRAVRRRRRMALGALMVILVLAVFATGVAIFAAVQRTSAIDRSHIAQADQMAADAASLDSTNTPLGMLVGMEAVKRAPTPQAIQALDDGAVEPLQAVLYGDGSSVNVVAFSANGKYLATGDNDGRVVVWDMTTRKKTPVRLPDGTPVEALAFSPLDSSLAIGDNDGRVVVWDPTIHVTTRVNFKDSHAVDALAFSSDGTNLAVGYDDGNVWVRDVSTEKTGAHFLVGTGHEGNEVTLAFSPDGTHLAMGDDGGNVADGDVATDTPGQSLKVGSEVESVAFDPSGRRILVGSYAGDVVNWTPGVSAVATQDGRQLEAVAFSPEDQLVATGDAAGNVVVWTPNGTQTTSFSDGSEVDSIAFSSGDPSGQLLATGDDAGNVVVWDMAKPSRVSFDDGSEIDSLAFSPNGQSLATADLNGKIIMRSMNNGAPMAQGVELWPIDAVAFSPDGHDVATGDAGGNVVVRNPNTWKMLETLPHRTSIDSMAFSPNSQHLAFGDYGGKVTVWNLTNHMRTFSDGTAVFSVAFSHDGQLLATGDDAGNVVVWNWQTPTGKERSFSDGSAVFCVAFSHDSRLLATGDDAGNVVVWNVRTGAKRTFSDGSSVTAVAFSPDGRLVTTDIAGNVNVWDPSTGGVTESFSDGHPVDSMAISTDGTRLATGDDAGNVVIFSSSLWRSGLDSSERDVCKEVAANMSRTEWATYLPGQPYEKTCAAYPSNPAGSARS